MIQTMEPHKIDTTYLRPTDDSLNTNCGDNLFLNADEITPSLQSNVRHSDIDDINRLTTDVNDNILNEMHNPLNKRNVSCHCIIKPYFLEYYR